MAQRQPTPRRTRPSKVSSDSSLHRRTRGASDRFRRPQDLLRADLEDRERMLEQIYRVIFEFAHDLDLNTQSTRRAFQKAERSVVKSPYRLREAVRFQTLHQIAEILDAWYREPAFLNEKGDPRPLPLVGLKSFSTLARRFLPGFNPRDIADILITERLLERDSQRVCHPLTAGGAFSGEKHADAGPRTGAPTCPLEHPAPQCAHRPGRPANQRCERGTLIDRLPVEADPGLQ